MSSQRNGAPLRISLKKSAKYTKATKRSDPGPTGHAKIKSLLSEEDRDRVEQEESEGEWLLDDDEDSDETNGLANADGYDFKDPFLDTADLPSDDAPPSIKLELERLERKHFERRTQEFKRQQENDRQLWIRIRRLCEQYTRPPHN